MSKEKEPDYVERYSPIDDIQSSHNELLKSTEYGHEDQQGYIYSEVALRGIYKYWKAEEENPIRSPRSKEVGKIIADRALLELAYRKGEIHKLENLYRLDG